MSLTFSFFYQNWRLAQRRLECSIVCMSVHTYRTSQGSVKAPGWHFLEMLQQVELRMRLSWKSRKTHPGGKGTINNGSQGHRQSNYHLGSAVVSPQTCSSPNTFSQFPINVYLQIHQIHKRVCKLVYWTADLFLYMYKVSIYHSAAVMRSSLGLA